MRLRVTAVLAGLLTVIGCAAHAPTNRPHEPVPRVSVAGNPDRPVHSPAQPPESLYQTALYTTSERSERFMRLRIPSGYILSPDERTFGDSFSSPDMARCVNSADSRYFHS